MQSRRKGKLTDDMEGHNNHAVGEGYPDRYGR